MDENDEPRAADAFNRGNAYMEKQKYDQAVAEYTEAIRKIQTTRGPIFVAASRMMRTASRIRP